MMTHAADTHTRVLEPQDMAWFSGTIMFGVLLHIVPLGLAAAASPVPVITGITLTGGRRPTLLLLTYILGGLLAYGVVGAIGIGLVGATDELSTKGHPSTLALAIQLAIGGFMLAAALFSFLTRRAEGGAPRWMKAIEGFGPWRSFLAGIVILSPRLKNLLLLAAALNLVGVARLGPISGALAILVFMGLTLAPVLAPLFVYLTQPAERAIAMTGRWKGWLERNNALILAAVFGVMGLKLTVDALMGFVG